MSKLDGVCLCPHCDLKNSDTCKSKILLPSLGRFQKWLNDNGMYQHNAEFIHKFLTTPSEEKR